MRRMHGFTLVEMLVVIAIIAALLAMLMPAMGKAIEAAHRSVCASQLHQQGVATIAFAADHFGHTPPAVVNQFSASIGAESAWFDGTPKFPEHGKYAGLGILFRFDYAADYNIAFCPSHLGKYWVAPGVQSPTVAGIMGFIQPESQMLPGTGSMSVTYIYRGTFGAPVYRSARLAQDGGDAPICADSFPLLRVAHSDGYNVARLDNAVIFADDPDEQVLNFNGGSSYHAGAIGYTLIEQVWQTLLSR